MLMNLIYRGNEEDDLADFADRLLGNTTSTDSICILATASDQEIVQALCVFLQVNVPDKAMQQRIRERLHEEWTHVRRERSGRSLGFG